MEGNGTGSRSLAGAVVAGIDTIYKAVPHLFSAECDCVPNLFSQR